VENKNSMLVFFSGCLFTYLYIKFRKYMNKRQFRKFANSISYKAEINERIQFKHESFDNPNFKNSDNGQLISSEQSLIREQLKRNYEFFGEEGMKKIINSFVVVVGIGGVGR
jgi:hypothetical protein